MNKYDTLEQLTRQRKTVIEQRAIIQKMWDRAAEEMNRAGEDLLEIDKMIKEIEGDIDMLLKPVIDWRWPPHDQHWFIPKRDWVFYDNLLSPGIKS